MPVLPNAVLPGPTGSANSSFGAQLGQAVNNSLLGSIGLTQAQVQGRQNVNSMFRYTMAAGAPTDIQFAPGFGNEANKDWRVRINLAPGSTYFYNNGSAASVLSPLTNVGSLPNSLSGAITGLFGNDALGVDRTGASRVGVVFPYTPQIQVTHNANYSAQKLTHTNYTQYFYDNSEVQAINITGDFTVQNINEGQYLLATIYFFRAITKMFFGQDGLMAGNPPPLVYLNGYGKYYFPNVPCLVTSFSHTMPSEVDYMDIPEPSFTMGSGASPTNTNPKLVSTRLPTTSSISLTLQPVYSRYAQSQKFSLNDFAAGNLINAQTGGQATAFGKFGGTNPGGFI